MSVESYDCAIVGGGPGGYPAAIRAAQLGLRTALVESAELGGICANWGCIPTKALLRAAELRHSAARAQEFGIEVGEVRVDLVKLVERSRRVADRMSGGVRHLLKKNGVTLIEGRARLRGAGRLEVDRDGARQELEAAHVVLATGARARTLPGIEPDGAAIWTYREAMVPERLPASLLVVGSGAIGIEFASFYRDLGVEVTVLEVLPRILPAEDEEISAFARKALEREGVAIHTEASLSALERSGDGVTARGKFASGQAFAMGAERAILAVGITGNVEGLGLETTAVAVESGHIETDAWGRTAEAGVYAIGDVAGPPYLAHKATHEGVLCIEAIAGRPGLHPLDATKIPGCTYSRPQVASVGLSERAAREAGHALRVGRFPLRANGKAVAIGDTEGLVKTVFDAETGELLGAHLVGPEVTEMIQGFVLARGLEATEAELIEAIFPHPTLSEAMHEAVLDAFGRAIHV